MWRNTRFWRWLIGGVAVVGVFVGPPAAKAVLQVKRLGVGRSSSAGRVEK